MSDGYIGCFEDSLPRILNGKPIILSPNSGRRCKAYCRQKRYRYAGTESGEECFCGHFLREKRPADSCDDECEGNPSEICGGHWRISIYDTWFCAVLPCKNGATCMDIDANSYKCICPYGWIGKRCEKEKTITSSSSATATVPKTTRSVYMSLAENNTVSTSTATSTNMTDVQYINSNAATSYQTNMLAYIIVPIALVSVGVIVIVLVVVVIKKRRQQRNGDDPYHIYCEPDVSGMTNLSPQLTNSQDASTEGKPKTANIQECQHTKQHVAGEESKSYMVTSDMRKSDNTYANREAINAKAMQSEWYEMLQQNRGSGSGYTAIDLHGARHSGERNYEVLNKDNVSDADYLKLHFSM